MIELRCRIKEIRTGGLGRVQKLMGLSIRETSETVSLTLRPWSGIDTVLPLIIP